MQDLAKALHVASASLRDVVGMAPAWGLTPFTLETPLWCGEGAGIACVQTGMVSQGGEHHFGAITAVPGAGFPAISKIQAPKQHLEKLLVLAVSSPLGQALRMLPRPFL